MEKEIFTGSTFESVFIIRAVQLYDDIVNLGWFNVLLYIATIDHRPPNTVCDITSLHSVIHHKSID